MNLSRTEKVFGQTVHLTSEEAGCIKSMSTSKAGDALFRTFKFLLRIAEAVTAAVEVVVEKVQSVISFQKEKHRRGSRPATTTRVMKTGFAHRMAFVPR